jgi:PhnB protein
MSATKPVPDGCGTVSAYLVVPSSKEALAFYERAFGAKPGLRMTGPDGSIMHAEMRIGNSTVMLTDENPRWNMKAPSSLGGSPASLHLYVEDADSLFARAVDAGCEVEHPIMDAFWGDRYGKVKDPFGYTWGIATHQEDLSEAEIERRQREFFREMAASQASA